MFLVAKSLSRVLCTFCLVAFYSGSFAAELTYSGAIKAGNESGSIPPWNGGLISPPDGWNKKMALKIPSPGKRLCL